MAFIYGVSVNMAVEETAARTTTTLGLLPKYDFFFPSLRLASNVANANSLQPGPGSCQCGQVVSIVGIETRVSGVLELCPINAG